MGAQAKDPHVLADPYFHWRPHHRIYRAAAILGAEKATRLSKFPVPALFFYAMKGGWKLQSSQSRISAHKYLRFSGPNVLLIVTCHMSQSCCHSLPTALDGISTRLLEEPVRSGCTTLHSSYMQCLCNPIPLHLRYECYFYHEKFRNHLDLVILEILKQDARCYRALLTCTSRPTAHDIFSRRTTTHIHFSGGVPSESLRFISATLSWSSFGKGGISDSRKFFLKDGDEYA